MDKLTTYDDLIKSNRIVSQCDLNLMAYCERLNIKTKYENVQNTKKSTTKSDDIAEPTVTDGERGVEDNKGNIRQGDGTGNKRKASGRPKKANDKNGAV